jgi:hemoglobin
MQTPITLYEKLGGQQGVKQVVDNFYNDVLADDAVNHFFAHTDKSLGCNATATAPR